MKREISITIFSILAILIIYTGVIQAHQRQNIIANKQYELLSVQTSSDSSEDWAKEIYTEPQKYYDIPLSAEIQQFIMDNCRDVDPRLIIAIAYTESGFNPSAISKDGLDVGLMGVRKKYATERMERLGACDLLDAHDNILVAVDKAMATGEKVYYLFENVASMQKIIKETLADILFKLYGGTMTEINSALVSAQNRKRIYFTNFGDIARPEDRGILLRDVLESKTSENHYFIDGIQNNFTDRETIRIGQLGKGGQGDRIYSPDGKSVCLSANGGGRGAKTGLYACPVEVEELSEDYFKGGFNEGNQPNLIGKIVCENTSDNKGQPAQGTRVYSPNGKSICLDADSRKYVIAPACLRYERTDYAKEIRKGYEDGTIEERMCNLRNLHPRTDAKTNTITTVQKDNMIIETSDGKTQPIYEVRNGLITIKDKQYPIKLADGFYIIRKLTPRECERLQTLPDDYTLWGAIAYAEDIAKKYKKSIEKGMARLDLDRNQIILKISDTQRYKMCGNGWTAEIISCILQHANIPLEEFIDIVALYDGLGTGRYCFDKLGYENLRYRAYETDEHASRVANFNYPDVIQMGDAFQVRIEDWGL